MNNKPLSWIKKYNNNNFIIASRAYFHHDGPPGHLLEVRVAFEHEEDECVVTVAFEEDENIEDDKSEGDGG